ncbi:hypothetical protein B0H19DRAFT_1270588 [Mycena capillaripes]|nr:hypothetical protein B0H19DRAFT_1270588 [Mycena capillaripes]
MCLPFFSHRCWQFNPDLEALFPIRERRMTLKGYLDVFLVSLGDAQSIARTSILSVAYCRTRGATAYLFLIIHLKHPQLFQFPARLKLQGFDSARTGVSSSRYAVTVAFVRESMMQLVGTWRYDVLHTMKFTTSANQPTVVDLLVLAELSTKWDHTRKGYPAILFSSLKTLYNDPYTTHTGVADLPGELAEEVKCTIIDAFPTRRQSMQEEIDFRSGFNFYAGGATRILELETENAELQNRAALLEEQVARLRLAAKVHNSRDADDADAFSGVPVQ